jgi:dienelactone hydrolase
MRHTTLFLGIAIAATTVGACASTPTAPDVRTRDITYTQNGTSLKGLLAWDENADGKRAGVLVVHEWWGHDEHARNQARRLAEEGYVALAVDMYGDGKTADTPDHAQQMMTEAVKDPQVAVARFNAARAALTADARVDPEKIAAIGYCFGGAVVLNMARAGHDLDAVVSFHGALQPAFTAAPGTIKPEILALTGEADPMVPADQVEAFRKEMTDAGARFRIVSYPGAKHSFTNPKAESHGMPQLGYNEAAARSSWTEMLELFRRIF